MFLQSSSFAFSGSASGESVWLDSNSAALAEKEINKIKDKIIILSGNEKNTSFTSSRWTIST